MENFEGNNLKSNERNIKDDLSLAKRELLEMMRPSLYGYSDVEGPNDHGRGPYVNREIYKGFRKDDFVWDGATPNSIAELPKWIRPSRLFPFSASSQIIPAFKHIGHMAKPDFGKIEPVLSIGDDTALAHLGLYAFGTLPSPEATRASVPRADADECETPPGPHLCCS